MKFWNWMPTSDPNAERELRLEGTIAEESWFMDEVSPADFRAELEAGNGPITVWINSPGGDVFAASQIYSMLRDYPNDVKVKIDGIAASAASVIAMAGTTVEMAPTAIIMIHNPMTMAFGNHDDMKQAIKMLDEVKESIINAYELKTGLSRDKISTLMDNETWMNAKKALELGFIDAILFSDGENDENGNAQNAFAYSRMVAVNNLLAKLPKDTRDQKEEVEPVTDSEGCVSIHELYDRLNKIKYH